MDQLTEISIRGMVCNRCISMLRTALESKGVLVHNISLGKVSLLKSSVASMEVVEETIKCLGFEILVERHARVVQTVKELVGTILATNRYSNVSFSDLISAGVKSSYDTVSAIFSAAEGMTLEHYIINQKIELVKEMLRQSGLSLTEIAYQTNYSSVHYLSRQFKAVTGVNPTEYRARASH